MMFIAGVFLHQREQSMNAKASLCSVCRLFLIGGRDRAWSAGMPKSGTAWSSAPKQCNQGKSRPWTWCCVSRASYSSLVISGQNLKSQRPAPAAADYRDNAFTDGHRLIGFSVRPCETKQPAKCVGKRFADDVALGIMGIQGVAPEDELPRRTLFGFWHYWNET
jgi:hypothetical protein